MIENAEPLASAACTHLAIPVDRPFRDEMSHAARALAFLGKLERSRVLQTAEGIP
jgi:hypothetical protein